MKNNFWVVFGQWPCDTYIVQCDNEPGADEGVSGPLSFRDAKKELIEHFKDRLDSYGGALKATRKLKKKDVREE